MEEASIDYWIENPDRWATMLIVANDISAMYSLPTLPEEQIRRLGGFKALPLMWWKGDGGRSTIGFRWSDPKFRGQFEALNCVSSEDRVCCMQAVVGILRDRMFLSAREVDCVLGLSRGTVCTMASGWDSQSKDFKTMIYGLSGDMRSKGLRHLVLGVTA
jgi:hypothetical protein